MRVVDRLKHYGYAIEPGVFLDGYCIEAAKWLDKIEAAGTKHDRQMQVVLHAIHEKDSRFIRWIDEPSIYKNIVEVLPWGEQIILNSLSASRSARVDDDTWEANADAHRAHIDHRLPTPDFENTASICVMVALDDFTLENGALKLWPMSHLAKERPPTDQSTLPPALACVVSKGSVIYWLGQTWHAIGRNLNGSRRWALIIQATPWWIKPTFSYDQCPSEIYAKLSLRQKGMLGFNSRPPAGKDGGRSYTVTPIEELA